MAARSERLEAIDLIKTLAIIAVVMTHAVLAPSWGRHSEWDDLLGRSWVSFHVPSFLAVSGFLYFRETAIGLRKILERLARVLVPYLIASFVALALGDVPNKEPGFLVRLATGNTQGHFYYVVLITAYLPLIGVLSRLQRRWIHLLFVFLLLYPLLAYFFQPFRFSETQLMRMRNPVYTAVYFVAGWSVALAFPSLQALAKRLGATRFWLGVAGAGVLAVLFYGLSPIPGRGWQIYLANRMIYTAGAIALSCALAAGLARLPVPADPVRSFLAFVSRSTYTIYLYHFLFIYPVRSLTLQWHPLVRIASVASVAFIGGCLVAWLAGRLLGPRAKWVTG